MFPPDTYTCIYNGYNTSQLANGLMIDDASTHACLASQIKLINKWRYKKRKLLAQADRVTGSTCIWDLLTTLHYTLIRAGLAIWSSNLHCMVLPMLRPGFVQSVTTGFERERERERELLAAGKAWRWERRCMHVLARVQLQCMRHETQAVASRPAASSQQPALGIEIGSEFVHHGMQRAQPKGLAFRSWENCLHACPSSYRSIVPSSIVWTDWDGHTLDHILYIQDGLQTMLRVTCYHVPTAATRILPRCTS
jgi:hypothetical protein